LIVSLSRRKSIVTTRVKVKANYVCSWNQETQQEDVFSYNYDIFVPEQLASSSAQGVQYSASEVQQTSETEANVEEVDYEWSEENQSDVMHEEEEIWTEWDEQHENNSTQNSAP